MSWWMPLAAGCRSSNPWPRRVPRDDVWIGLHENTVTIDSHEVTLAERRVQGSYAASLDELKMLWTSSQAGGLTDKLDQDLPSRGGVEAFRSMLAARGITSRGIAANIGPIGPISPIC